MASSLYVGDLHPDVTEQMLDKKISTCGRIFSIRVCRDRVSGRSLGYAYVNFRRKLDAQRAKATFNFDKIKGHSIRIMWCQRDRALRDSGIANVFVGNLDKRIEHRELHEFFSAFGQILSCKIASDANGSKGYGYVQFTKVEDANRSIEICNGLYLKDNKIRVCNFIPREVRLLYQSRNKRTNTQIPQETNISSTHVEQRVKKEQPQGAFLYDDGAKCVKLEENLSH